MRSRRNWGHGDFTDLAELLGWRRGSVPPGSALNPLHALFDDQPEQASPYSPNSRLFLNPLYIDVSAIPEFPGVDAAGIGRGDRAAAATATCVDYGGVARRQARGPAARL